MLKWIVGIAIAITAVVVVAREQHYAREKYEASRQEACISLSVSIEEKHACAKEAQSRKDYAPWWNILVTWPEGITTWAIIATGFIIGWQSNETRKAADAALLNAKAVIIGQRPWLLIKPRPQTPTVVQNLSFVFTNHGASPARILHTYFGSCFVPMQEQLSQVSDPWTEGMHSTHVEWIDPGGERPIEGSMPVNVVQPELEDYDHALRTGQKRVWLWGAIRYQGTFGDEIYESKFCYMWTPRGKFVMGGPPGSNDYK